MDNDLKVTEQAVHIADVIFRKLGLTVWEGFPEGWTDEIVCGSFRRNKDGSITVDCCINVYADDGTVYGVDSRMIRLPKKR